MKTINTSCHKLDTRRKRIILKCSFVAGCILLLIILLTGNRLSADLCCTPRTKHPQQWSQYHTAIVYDIFTHDISSQERYRAEVKQYINETSTDVKPETINKMMIKATPNYHEGDEMTGVGHHQNKQFLNVTSRPNTAKNKCGQIERQNLLKSKCDVLKYGYVKESVSLILADDIHKVLYCEVPKVACTSWKAFLANLTGKVKPEDYERLYELVHSTDYYPSIGFKYLKDFTNIEREYRIQNYFKFIVVRNPYTRLVSAYENKFAADNKYFHDNVGTYIVRYYRKNATAESLRTGSDVTFEEFVRFVVNEDEDLFWRHDSHWWRIYSNCFPCHLQYDYIAKLETLNQDLNNIIDQILPNSEKARTLSKQFPHMNSSEKSKEEILRYYRTLPADLLYKVKEFYNVDLTLFGYSIDSDEEECSQ